MHDTLQCCPSMSAEEVAEVFAALGDWFTRFDIGGISYGGSFDAIGDPRIDAFFAEFPGVETVLELGALEGGHTIALARRPHVKRVLGIEGRPENLARARLAAQLLRADKVQFAEANLEAVDLRAFGKFDAIFCSGVLYHLPEPWKLLRQFTSVSPRAFLWTHYCEEKSAALTCAGYRGRMQGEAGLADPLSGLSPVSFWPTLGSLEQMLRDSGFTAWRILGCEPAQKNGPAVAIAAKRDGA